MVHGRIFLHDESSRAGASLRVRRTARRTTMNSPAAVLALMLVMVLAGRDSAPRFLSRLRVTPLATRSVFNIGTLCSVARTILGPVLVRCHAVPREMSPC